MKKFLKILTTTALLAIAASKAKFLRGWLGDKLEKIDTDEIKKAVE